MEMQTFGGYIFMLFATFLIKISFFLFFRMVWILEMFFFKK